MVSKVFLDANVILEFALNRLNRNTAEIVMNSVMHGRFKAYITPSVVHITNYWLAKSLGANKSKELIIALLDDVRVIDCPHATVITALHSNINDVEDALQYYTAIHHKLDCFITLDQKLHKSAIAVLPVYYPDEFVQKFIMFKLIDLL